MLQRAASNAYSWWWASHIRTKQSKWLEHNMQDMDDKVKEVIEILEEDGDSFSKRAEMYYKRRPEIVDFVEESYKQYRALADRYDHLSRELQSANRTIAMAFPEQIPFMDEEEPTTLSPPPVNTASIAAPPAAPPRQPVLKRNYAIKTVHRPKKSAEKLGLNQAAAVEKIDRIQKQILTLQTEKEFVKCSYESRLARCSEIEDLITEAQQKVCGLQDEFGVGSVIEDDDARYLMAATALKSSQQLLHQLQERRDESIQESMAAFEKIVVAQEKLRRVTGKTEEEVKEEDDGLAEMTVLAEEINEHVSKVLSLETIASSHSSMVTRLTSVADELHSRMQSLETAEEGSTFNMEEELSMVQQLQKGVQFQNELLHSNLMEAASTHDSLTRRLEKSNNKGVAGEETREKETTQNESNLPPPHSELKTDEMLEENQPDSTSVLNPKDEETIRKEEGEKALLEEYSAVLRDYMELKEEFSEMEKKNRDCIFNTAIQMRELRKSNAVKEEEIQHLRNKVASSSSSPTQKEEVEEKEESSKRRRSKTEEEEEKGLRESIDQFLEEDTDIWLRVSCMLQQVHKFEASMRDLEEEASRKECEAQQPIYKHMREIEREVKVWMEQRWELKEKVERRWVEQRGIEDEIEKGGGGGGRLMGEVVSMRRQNERVVKELEVGGERVKQLQEEIEIWLKKKKRGYGGEEVISSTSMVSPPPPPKQRIPLRSFLFGVKIKKHKPSLFSCINPALHKQFSMHTFDVTTKRL